MALLESATSQRNSGNALDDKVLMEALLRGEKSSSACVTFEMLADESTPISQITERLIRLLEYEPLHGVREAILIAFKLAGVNDYKIEIPIVMPEAMVHLLDNNTDDPSLTTITPLSPAARKLIETRLSKLWSESLDLLHGICAGSMLNTLTLYYSALTAVNLRPLRKVATSIVENMLTIMKAQGHAAEISTVMDYSMRSRSGDVDPTIRHIAFRGLATMGQTRYMEKALNDSVASIRLLAISVLMNEGIKKGFGWNRIQEMSFRDTDIKVRHKALKALASSAAYAKDSLKLCAMALAGTDVNDVTGQNLAADVLAKGTQPDGNAGAVFARLGLPDTVQHFMQILNLPPPLLKSKPCLRAIAKACYRLPDSDNSVGARPIRRAVGVGKLLVFDYAKDPQSRQSGKASDRAVKAEMEAKLTSLDARTTLISLFSGLVESQTGDFHELLTGVGGFKSVWKTVSYNDELLAKALSAIGNARVVESKSFDSLETEFALLLKEAVVYFEERPTQGILEGCSALFKIAVKYPALKYDLEQLVLSVKMSLAVALGPGGRDADKNKDQVLAGIRQAQILARVVSIDDLCGLPIWNGEAFTPLVRALAFSETESVVKEVIEKLKSRSPQSTELLVEAYVVAKMRDFALDCDLKADEVGNISGRTWQAAVAAGIF